MKSYKETTTNCYSYTFIFTLNKKNDKEERKKVLLLNVIFLFKST
jgi:hypothetical protein